MHNEFNHLCESIHKLNRRWWEDPRSGKRIDRNKFEMLALIHSELSEALEGIRKDKMDDHLPHLLSVNVELADALIRLLDYCGGHCYDMDAAFRVEHPLFADKSISGGLRYFRQRFFSRAQNKAEQIDILHCAVCKVSELEHSGAPSAMVASALVWTFALLYDFCAIWGLDLVRAVKEKIEYNKLRQDHTNEARLSAGGKRF